MVEEIYRKEFFIMRVQNLSGLQNLSDEKLLSGTIEAARNEKESLARVITYLVEVDARKLYLKKGYRSLHDFVVRKLGYSDGTAARRVAAARVAGDCPEFIDQLRTGESSLCAATTLQRTMMERERLRKEELKKRSEPSIFEKKPPEPSVVYGFDFSQNGLENEKRREAEQVKGNADAAPTESPSSSSYERLTKTEKREILEQIKGKRSYEMKEAIQKAVLPETAATAIRPRSQWGAVHSEFKELKVYLSEKERIQLQRLSDLLSHALGTTEPSAVIGRMLEEGLEKHDPIRIEARREIARKKKEMAAQKESLFHDAVSNRDEVDLSEVQPIPLQNDAKSNRGEVATHQIDHQQPHCGADRHLHSTIGASSNHRGLIFPNKNTAPIPVALKRQVQIRDGHEGCQYPGPDGKKCGATRFLDIDHVIPRAQGGPNTLDNLRLVCASHNRNRQWIETPHLIPGRSSASL